MKKIVLKLDLHNEKGMKKAMKKASGLLGVDSVDMDMKNKKLTVTGDIDPVIVVAKLKKICGTQVVTIGPAKEPEKKKKDSVQRQCYCVHRICHHHPCPRQASYMVHVEDTDGPSCVIL